MIRLSRNQILRLHKNLVEKFGEIFGVAENSVAYEDFLNWLEAHIQNEN